MKTILFLLALMALACGGLYATPEDSYTTQFIGSCYDNHPKENSIRKIWDDEIMRHDTDLKMKETMLKGYLLVSIEKVKKSPLNCIYLFKKSEDSLPVIQAKMANYEKQYLALLGADLKLPLAQRKLDQNVRYLTKSARNAYYYEYRSSAFLDKGTHLHVFVANCSYPKGKEWDAITRETELNLTLSAILSADHFLPQHCLYYFTPDLSKFNP